MDTAEEPQQLEITALRSIYAEEFIDVPPPTVWKVGLVSQPARAF
jgi:translation initiation factor 2-alpha kinase 4